MKATACMFKKEAFSPWTMGILVHGDGGSPQIVDSAGKPVVAPIFDLKEQPWHGCFNWEGP